MGSEDIYVYKLEKQTRYYSKCHTWCFTEECQRGLEQHEGK